jgi:hypothetical protein
LPPSQIDHRTTVQHSKLPSSQCAGLPGCLVARTGGLCRQNVGHSYSPLQALTPPPPPPPPPAHTLSAK